LHRLYCYVFGNHDLVIQGVLSTSDIDNLTLDVWVDADLAGDTFDAKSTSGRFIELSGLAGRSMPLTWAARKQTGTAKHTQDAEIVSMATGMAEDGIPIQDLLARILRRPVKLLCREDNSAAISAARKGYSPALRHLPRTQRISISSVNEMFYDETMNNTESG
jgi:hypothetical protein